MPQESESLYRSIFETIGLATVLIEEDMLITLANTAFENLAGYSKEEMENKKNWGEFLNDGDLKRFIEYRRLSKTAPKDSPTRLELIFIDRQGARKGTLVSASAVPGSEAEIVTLLIVNDNSELEQQFYYLTTTDILTGARNTRYYMELTEKEFSRSMRTGQDFSVIFIRIADMLDIYDQVGRSNGDKVLVEVGRILRTTVRETDVVGRVGDCEFAVTLANCNVTSAGNLMERLHRKINTEVYDFHEVLIRPLVDLGAAQVADLDKSVFDVFKRAEQALEIARKSERHRAVLDL